MNHQLFQVTFLLVAVAFGLAAQAAHAGGVDQPGVDTPRGVTNASNNSGASMFPVSQVDTDGNIHLAWMDDTNNLEILYARSKREKWSRPTNVSNSPTGSLFPSMAIDPSGGVHLAWMEGEGEQFDIYYGHSTPNGWSKPLNLSHAKGISQRPQIAIDSSGTVHIVWFDNIGGFLELFHCRRAGESWTKPANTGLVDWYITHDPGLSRSATLDADHRGQIHLVWVDIDTSDVMQQELFHSRWDGKTWSKPQNASNRRTMPASPKDISADVDVVGNVHLSWEDKTEVWYCRAEGQRWLPAVRISRAGHESGLPALSTAPGGNVHIAWVGETLGPSQLFYRRFNGEAWLETVRLTKSPGNSVGAAMSIGKSGVLHVSWMDDTPGDFEIFHRQGPPKALELRQDPIDELEAFGADIKRDEERNAVSINLVNIAIDDASLAALSGLTTLRELNLAGTNVTDAGLVHLRGLTNLRKLDLACTQITDSGVAELKQTLPRCDIPWVKFDSQAAAGERPLLHFQRMPEALEEIGTVARFSDGRPREEAAKCVRCGMVAPRHLVCVLCGIRPRIADAPDQYAGRVGSEVTRGYQE